MVTSVFRPEVEIWPFRACTMHPAIIIGTVRSLWTRVWGRYHVPQSAFVVQNVFTFGKHKPLLVPEEPHRVCLWADNCWWNLDRGRYRHYVGLHFESWQRARVGWHPDVWAVPSAGATASGRASFGRDGDSRSVTDEQLLLPDGSARPLRLKVADARTPNLTNYSNREKWHRMMVRSSKSGCLCYQGIR